MKKLITIAACAALAACGSNEAEEAVDTDDAAVAETDTASASQMAGTYELKLEDGTVVSQQVNADGTFVDSDLDGNVLQSGTWRQEGSQMCYDVEGDAPEVCWAGGEAGPDGAFEATSGDGSATIEIRRVGG